MPSLSMQNLPAPSDSAEFERLLMDYSAAKYEGTAKLWGRKGQSQNGIDIIVTRIDGSLVCVQCKDYINKAITTKLLDECIDDVENCGLPVLHFEIALACERDVRLQKHIVLVNSDRLKLNKFSVELVFWDNIQHFVKHNENILRIYYPEFFRAGMRDYSELITSDKDLRLSFLNLLVKFKIEDFLTIDPFIGLFSWQVEAYDEFHHGVEEIMTRAAAITSTKIYADIAEFMNWVDAFCTLIMLRVHTDDGNFAVVRNPFYIKDRAEIEGSLKEFREKAIQALQQIK